MSLTSLRYKLAPYGEAVVGTGAYSIVYKATEEGTKNQVAVKKSRVSKEVKRPILQHESRVLQLLQGHATIPAIYGYGQLEHFEYIAMEFLGPSIKSQQKDGAGLMVKTVIQIVDQVLAALQYIHSRGIVHCDIKPDNLLCSLENDSVIKIIDFGLSKLASRSQPTKYDPFKERKTIIGTLTWASLNSHNGIDLSWRDDLESLAYTALFLLRGNFPWKSRPTTEELDVSQEIVRLMKMRCSGPALSIGFPDEFGDMLTYGRSLEFDQIPDYAKLRSTFSGLAGRIGCSLDGSLDWTPCYPETTNPLLGEPEIEVVLPDNVDDDSDDTCSIGSYFGVDIDAWERNGERDKELTLPAKQESELDSLIPLIAEVQGNF